MVAKIRDKEGEHFMKHIALEAELKKRIKKRRIIESALSAIFFGILIVFIVLYEQGYQSFKKIKVFLVKATYIRYIIYNNRQLM